MIFFHVEIGLGVSIRRAICKENATRMLLNAAAKSGQKRRAICKENATRMLLNAAAKSGQKRRAICKENATECCSKKWTDAESNL